MEKVYSIQEQMSIVSRKMELLRKNQKEMLELKNTVTQIKNACNGFSTAEERVSEPQDMLIETSKSKEKKD